MNYHLLMNQIHEFTNNNAEIFLCFDFFFKMITNSTCPDCLFNQCLKTHTVINAMFISVDKITQF